MENIADYIIQKKIYETEHSLVYQAQKENWDKTFIIKAIKAENPSASELARFKQEYELIKSIELDGVIKVFDIIRHGNGFALVLEDFNGTSIKNILNKNGKLDIITFLKIAIPLSQTIG
ncbi:MAG: protein kinase, partial [Desulfobacula sp.]|nr:protein kinase [Desulfobacula sp.]